MLRALCLLLLPTLSFAQTDSVIVTGQVRHLSAKTYRQSPNVVIARTNLARGGSEQAFVGPLQPDGRFRVAVPIIFPQEEMAFQVAGATAPFLAAAGQLSIEVDNDSLGAAVLPIRYGGVNAQVNQQIEQYQAYAYRLGQNRKTERERQMRRAASATSLSNAYQFALAAFAAPLDSFSVRREVFPLVRDWVRSNAHFEAATLVYEKAIGTGQRIQTDILTTLWKANDNLLTPARANALSRFGTYASGQLQQLTEGQAVKVRLLASLLSRYGRNLTTDDQEKLAIIREKGSVRSVEMRYLSTLLERNADTLNRLMMYENAMQAARTIFDTTQLDYLKAYALTSVAPQATLNVIRFFGQYIRPQISGARLRQSFDEVVSQALRDTALVREAKAMYLKQAKQTGVNYGPLGNGIFASTGAFRTGDELLQNALDRNRGKAVYVVLWSPSQEISRQLALDSQRLLEAFDPRDFTLLYIGLSDADESLWLESIVRNRLRGEHIRLTDPQYNDVVGQLNLFDARPVRLFTPQGKLMKRDALFPDDIDKLVAQIESLLR